VGGRSLRRVLITTLGALLALAAMALIPADWGLPGASPANAQSEPEPGISIEKSPDQQIVDAGADATFTIVVTNTSTADLTDVIVGDPLAPDCSRTIGTLAPGGSSSFDCTLTDVQVDLINVATATGTPPAGPAVADSDVAEVIVRQQAAILVAKDPDLQVIPADTAADVGWTITVSNIGAAVLFHVLVADPQVPACSHDEAAVATALGKAEATMDPGESFSYQCTVAGLTLGVTDTFVNTTTASGTDRFEDTVTDSDDASVVTFAVLASGLVGDTVWNDLDGDGVQDAGEPGIGGATVRLTDLATGEVTTKTTDGDGKYLFAALEAGSYRTELVVSSVGGTLTTPGDFTITLAEGEARLDADFGVQDALPVTGFDLDILALVALGLLTLGAIALIATRRREAEEPGV
jgi:uncharacterized repeat protein (TIGR01451 family)/LPXTG-motif cell wall-anchored protein